MTDAYFRRRQRAMLQKDAADNEFRRELLDHRAKTVDWWLAATAIFLTLLGIAAVIAGYISFQRFSEIEAEALKNVESSRMHAETVRAFADKSKAEYYELKFRDSFLQEAIDNLLNNI